MIVFGGGCRNVSREVRVPIQIVAMQVLAQGNWLGHGNDAV